MRKGCDDFSIKPRLQETGRVCSTMALRAAGSTKCNAHQSFFRANTTEGFSSCFSSLERIGVASLVVSFALAVSVGLAGTSVALASTDIHVSMRSTAFGKGYLSFNKSVEALTQLVRGYPALAKLYSIGKSTQRRDLFVVKLSTDRSQRSPLKPMVKLVGGIHGNEALSSQLLLMLVNYLLREFGKNNRITRLLSQTEIHVLPIANPDGREVATEGDCEGAGGDSLPTGRNNANDIDLNEDFPGPFDSNQDAWQGKQNETLALMRWIVASPFVLSASIHAGALVASYPYDWHSKGLESSSSASTRFNNPTPDDEVFQHLARTYAKNNPKLHRGPSCEKNYFKDGITNGARWFPVKGTMGDFNYAFSNCFEVTLELSCCKFPNASQLELEWNNNWLSFVGFMEQVHMGIKGFIRNRDSMAAVQQATVFVEGISHNVTSSTRGEFWRLLLPGTYNITVSAPGYQSITKTNLSVLTGAATTVNILLEPQMIKQRGHDDTSADAQIPEKDNIDFQFKTPPQFHHHNYNEMTMYLRSLAERFPYITRLTTIGKTVQDRELWVLEISDNPGVHEAGEPEMKVVANMHGNEVVGREMSLLLAQLLCESYGRNQRLTKLVNTTRIFLLPSMNPDGYEQAKEGDYSSLVGRFNANGVDLNRNFPDQYFGNKTEAGLNRFEPETIAMMKWITTRPFVLSANLHGGALVANYPYDGNVAKMDHLYSGTPDDGLFRWLAGTYAALHPTMHLGRPCPEGFKERFEGGITNGAQWYSLYGGMQDFNYLHSNCFELTIEMGCQKFPLANQLQSFWNDHKRSLLKFIELTHMGITGFVLDESGYPVHNASIHVSGIQRDVRTALDGDFWRLLLPGTYQVSAVIDGIHADTKQVSVPDDISLQPIKVNFTVSLERVRWSKKHDFSISENIIDKYSTLRELNNEMNLIRENNQAIVRVKQVFDNSTSLLEFMQISNEMFQGPKPHILLMSGLHGAQPVSREILIRFARHLVEGYRRQERIYCDLIDHAIVHVVPYVDSSATSLEGNCGGSTVELNNDSHLSSYNNPGWLVKTLLRMFDSYGYVAALSIESGEMFFYTGANSRDAGVSTNGVEHVNVQTKAAAGVFGIERPLLNVSDSDTAHLFNSLLLGGDLERAVRTAATAAARKASGCAGKSKTLRRGVAGAREVKDASGRGLIVDRSDDKFQSLSTMHPSLRILYGRYSSLAAAALIDCCVHPPASQLFSVYRRALPALLEFTLRAHSLAATGSIRVEDRQQPLPPSVVRNVQLTITPGNRPDVPVLADGSFAFLAPKGALYIAASAPGYELALSVARKASTPLQIAPIQLTPSADDTNRFSGGYDRLRELLHDVAHRYSSITKLSSLGQSSHMSEKRDLWLLEISAAPVRSNGSLQRPAVLISAGHAGIDLAAIEIALKLGNLLASRYTKDAAISRILNTTRVFIVPALAVDEILSEKEAKNFDCSQTFATAYNLSSLRLRYDFASSRIITSDVASDAGGASWSSIAFSNWLSYSIPQVVLSLSLRAGPSGTLLYSGPVGAQERAAAIIGQTVHRLLLQLMPKTVRLAGSLERRSCSISSLLTQSNEANIKLSLTAGSPHRNVKLIDSSSSALVDDLGVYNIRSLKGTTETLETAISEAGAVSLVAFISCCPAPSVQQRSLISQSFKPALIKLLLMAHEGIEGRVEGAHGEGDLPGSQIFVDSRPLAKRSDRNGLFYLVVPPGQYAIEVTHPGYLNMTKLISVPDGDPRTAVVFRLDAARIFFGGRSSSFLLLIVIIVSIGISGLVLSRLLYNGTLCGRGEALRRKGFLPLATNDDTILLDPNGPGKMTPEAFEFMKCASSAGISHKFNSLYESKGVNRSSRPVSTPQGYSDLRALELSDTDSDDEDNEVYQPQFRHQPA